VYSDNAASWLLRVLGWIAFSPAWLGFRLIWLAAWLGNRDALDVQRVMWDAGLAIPPLTAEQKADPFAPPIYVRATLSSNPSEEVGE
jgi:hypothetical protein